MPPALDATAVFIAGISQECFVCMYVPYLAIIAQKEILLLTVDTKSSCE